MRSLLICLLVLTASASEAASLSLVMPAGVDLQQQKATSRTGADLVVFDRVLIAQHGIALAPASTDFQQQAPLVLDADYRVRDAAGGVHQVRVHAVHGKNVVLTTTTGEEAETATERRLGGRYETALVRIGGEVSEAKYPDLVLHSDGTFQIGGVTGDWTSVKGALSLGGYYANWGMADVSGRGDQIRFRFSRGHLEFEVTLHRAPAGTTLVSQVTAVR